MRGRLFHKPGGITDQITPDAGKQKRDYLFRPIVWGAGFDEAAEAMTRTEFCHSVEIPAPPPLVWSVMADVERWPEWTASVSHVKLPSPGPLQVGSRVWIYQPKLPPALWRVTELNPGAGFTWFSRAPGVRVTARHMAEKIAGGTRANLSIRYEGLLGTLLARWVGELNDRYLAIEASGLRERCTELATKQRLENPDMDYQKADRRAGGD